jgi:hypothetical protein
MTNTAPPIDQTEFSETDHEIAEKVAKRLGYEQTAYTSTSGLWGLFCLPENPNDRRDPRPKHLPPFVRGCIIKTKQFGLMFVADLEDLHMDDLNERQAV